MSEVLGSIFGRLKRAVDPSVRHLFRQVQVFINAHSLSVEAMKAETFRFLRAECHHLLFGKHDSENIKCFQGGVLFYDSEAITFVRAIEKRLL